MAQSNPPLVRIGQTAIAPVIDGNLDDAAWKHSIGISDFTVTGSETPAAAPTLVRMSYDQQNLYLSWRCQEPLLTVAQQRMQEVRAEAKTPDSDVFSDDCVLLFLQPRQDGTVYEFDVNSIGTLFDARSKASDLWKTRDASWNSGAKAAAVREDGFWTAELAIPWKAFGMDAPPAAETNWPLSLERRAVGRNESSSWNQSESASIHLFNQWGQMVFGDSVPSIMPQPLGNFEAGKSVFAAQVSPPENASSQVDVEVGISNDNRVQQFQNSGTYNKVTDIKIPITATSEAPLLQWDVKGAGGKYLYRSPRILISAQSSLAHLQITTAQAWKLFVNNSQISEGNAAQNQNISFPLVDGVNDIVVQAQSGQAQLQLDTPGFTPDEKIAWRTHATGDANVLSGTDWHEWQIAPEQNGVTGTASVPAFLQHTLLWKSTLSYPVAQPAFYIAAGTAQQITFLVEGIEGVRLDDWQMLLAVPSEFEVLGSSGFYGRYIAGKSQFHTVKAGDTVINGNAMTLYRITADKPLIYQPNQQTILVSFEVLVRLPKTVNADVQKEWPFYYWTNANQGTVSEAPQAILVRALPPLKGKQPKKFVWELWASGTHVYDDQNLVGDILDTARQAGFNTYQASSQKTFNSLVQSYGMKAFTLVNFSDSRTMNITKPYLAQHPEDALVDKDGKRSAVYMCTTQLLGKNWPMYEKSIEDVVKTSGADEIEYDYEYPPFNPPHACFCDRCLAAFREFSKIDPKVDLTPALVQKEYRAQWVNFMAYRTATLLKKMKDAVHAANPEVRFAAYSGYYDASDNTTKTQYGIDWNLVGQMQSVDEAGMGYGRPSPGITDSVTALRGIPVEFGELLTPYDVHSRQPVAPLQRATLLRRALDATRGVLIYERNSMDGRSWQAVADVSRLTADYENTFLQKTLQDIPGQDSASVQIVRGGGHTLLCVMNLTNSTKKAFTLQIPAGLGDGKEYYSGEKVQGGQTLQVTLAPGDVKVFVFGG